MKEESATEVANKILAEYLEGKSFYFIKDVCESISSVFDNNYLTDSEIKNHKVTSEKLSTLHQLVQQTLKP